MSASLAIGSPPSSRAVSAPSGGDLVRSYLRDIGRVPLLSHEQEI
ncbi:MAG: RNA polymerase sigma factor, RpoD/SigA family, partial [Cyanobacteria bacterium]|nr:RNA polymerase sigma factor, RpoD/SigA family [Cyanobacteriota bacterium]